MTTATTVGLTALGVYIFAGGFTLGVRKRFKVLAHLEDGPFGVKTALHNGIIPEAHTDVAAWPVEKFAGVDLIYGNPPCAPWSSAGHLPKQSSRLASHGVNAKYELDPRVECVRRQFDLLGRLRPKVWVWESVARAFTTGKPFVDQLAARALALGYAVTLVLVDGRWCGLPQRRRRFFFVAHRVAIPFRHPGRQPATVGEVWARYDEAQLAIQHPDNDWKLKGQFAEYVGDVKPGEGAIDAFYRWKERMGQPLEYNERGYMKGRPNFLTYRVARDKVSGTIVSGASLIHPEENRILTVRETQVLCGYPVNFEFIGRDAYAQISKAVMPPVAEWLADCVADGLKAGQPAPAVLTVADFMKEASGASAVPSYKS